MKKLTYYFAAAAALTLGVACDSDDENNGGLAQDPVQVTNTITSGTWRITQFRDDDQDRTALYSGFTFTFNSDNTVVATNASDNYSGIWGVFNDDDDDDGIDDDDLDFLLTFGAPSLLQQLSDDDWEVRQRTSTRIRLSDDDDDDDDDVLVFEKI